MKSMADVNHHARISTETASRTKRQSVRLTERCFTESNPRYTSIERNSYLAANRWTDGPAASEDRRSQRRNDSLSSDSTPTPGIFSKLICQASIHKNPRRSHNTLFMNRLSLRRKLKQTYHRPRANSSKESNRRLRPLQNLTSYAVQRIPSALRLRRTQSAPRLTVEHASYFDEMNRPRNHSSNPSIGSPLIYPYQLPNVQYLSATSVTQCRVPDSMRACGRGDLIAAQHYHEESHQAMSGTPEQVRYGSCERAQSKSSLEGREPLVKIIIQAAPDDDESSGSEMLRDKKRKSIISEAGTADPRVVERFKPKVQDECEDDEDSPCSV